MREHERNPYEQPRATLAAVADPPKSWMHVLGILLCLPLGFASGLLPAVLLWLGNLLFAYALRDRLLKPWGLPLWPVPWWVTLGQLLLLFVSGLLHHLPFVLVMVALWALGVPGVNLVARLMRGKRQRLDGFEDLGV